MRFHEYIGSTGYEILHTIGSGDWEIFVELDGSPRAHNWKPVPVRRVRPSLRERNRASDSPYYGAECMMFRRSAVDALRDMLDAHGELLPLEDEGGVELYAYNPRALDALDQVLSEGNRDETGRLEGVRRHVFIPSIVEGVDIVKQACPRAGGIYLSERFLQRWKQAKLKGLDFRLVWDSDLPPEKQPGPWVPGSKYIKL